VVGLVKESLESFQLTLQNPAKMAACSQLAAAAIGRLYGADSLGFNPFSDPRLDEEQELTLEQKTELSQFSLAEQEEGSKQALPAEILEGTGYGRGAERFQVNPGFPWFGFWAVSNEWKKTADLPSIKEQKSYIALERPYRFLQSIDRKTVDQETENATAMIRKQVPVLVDFNEGRIYIESTDKKLIYAIIVRLSQMGAEIIPVAWSYGAHNWTEKILNRLYDKTSYGDEFVKRAEELKRFRENEIEKLEDREMEAIVSKYFSMTELATGLWIGISGPAKIRLHETTPALGIKGPASATTLLHVSQESEIVEGVLNFQEVATVTMKDGSERRIRRDVVRVSLNDRINLSDVGAAMLRGFDLTTHKKDVQRAIKQTRQVPTIPQFWSGWLHQLSLAVRMMESAFREILELDAEQPGGIIAMQIQEKVEVPAD